MGQRIMTAGHVLKVNSQPFLGRIGVNLKPGFKRRIELLEHDGLPRFHRATIFHFERRSPGRCKFNPYIAADQFVAVALEQFLGLPVQISKIPLGIHRKKRIGNTFQCVKQPCGQIAGFLRHPALLVDLGQGAEPFKRAVDLIANPDGPRQMPAVFAVGAAQTHFNLVRLPGLQGTLPNLEHRRHIVRVQIMLPLIFLETPMGHVRILKKQGRDILDVTIFSGRPDSNRHGFRQLLEALQADP